MMHNGKKYTKSLVTTAETIRSQRATMKFSR